MPVTLPYTLSIDHALREEELRTGVYLVIVHALRVPPHIGMIVDGQYHSLSIKGQELDVPVEAFVRNTSLRRIPALFVKIGPAAASAGALKALLNGFIRQFPKVEAGKSTCLSPVKLFFEAAYGVPVRDVRYVFELLPELEAKSLIAGVSSLYIEGNRLQLPVYSMDDINGGIAKAEQEAREITRTAGN